jgi:hypothetical protein
MGKIIILQFLVRDPDYFLFKIYNARSYIYNVIYLN